MKQTFTAKHALFSFLATFLSVATSLAQTTITTGTPSPASVCQGSEVSVPFTTTGAVVPLTNFVAQLSNAAGSFDTPAEIGSAATSPITAKIPEGAAAGAGYKVRVISVLTLVTVREGSEVALTINAMPAAPTVTSPVNYKQNAKATALDATGDNLLWYAGATGGEGGAAPTPETTEVGTKSYYVSQTVTGCESTRAKIDVVIAACTPPAKPAVEDISYKVGDKAEPLKATPASNLLWYTSETGGTGTATAPTPSTDAVGTTSYFVSRKADNCESERVELKVTVSACATVAPDVSNKTYNVGDKADVLTASGTGLKWYTAASGGSGSATAPTPTTTAPGEQRFYVSQTPSGGCEGPRAEIIITVVCATPKPTVENKSYTIGQNASELEATGTGLKWYTSETGGTGSTSGPTPSTNAAGTTTYYVTQTLNNCESERAAIVVTVSACATPAPTVANKSYKVGDKADALTAVGTGLKWYAAANGGTGSATAPTPTTTAPGEQRFYVSQTPSGGCEGPRAEIVVTVNCATPKPTVENKSYTIGQNAPVLEATGTAVKWYTSETGGTGSTTAPKPATTTAGSTTYYVTQTLNNCESERAAIVVTVSACVLSAEPNVTSETEYCASTTAIQPLKTEGTAVKWYNSNGAAIPAPTPNMNVATTTEYKYFITQTQAGKCESPKKEVIVKVYKTAAPIVSNMPVEYCLNEKATPLQAQGTALKWYNSLTGMTEVSSTPDTKAPGNQVFYVTQTLNGCVSERARIDVRVKALPNKPTVAAISAVCVNTQIASSVLLNAVTPKTNLVWYENATVSNGTSTPPAIDTKTGGSKIIYVTQTSNGCESERAAVTIPVTALPAAPQVTAKVEYCKDVTDATTLTATGTALKWYNASGGVITAPKPETKTVGDISYFVTQTVASCESPKAEINVVINALPANATVVTPEAICQIEEDKLVAFSATGSSGNTFNWYSQLDSKTKEASVPTVNLKNAGTTIRYVTQVSDKGCESPVRVAKTIRVKPLPALPTIANPSIEYCQFIKADPLTATPVANGILDWYGTNETGGTPSKVAPTPSTAEGGTTSYFVGQSLEGCAGDRAKIDVKINTTPKPETTTSLAYCQNEAAGPLSANGSSLKWYREADDTEFRTSPFTPFTERVQDYSFFVTQTGANGCESPKEEIKIHIKSLPSATISGNPAIDLGETASINIRFTGDGPWIYVLSNGTTDTTDQANHNVEVKPTTTTSYLITEVRNACGKGTPIGSARVTVRVPTITSGNPSVSEACASKTFNVPFQQSGDFPAGNTFKIQISTENRDSAFVTIPSTAMGNSVTATIPDTTLGGAYFIRVISSGANPDFMVKGSVSSITVNVSPLPVATISGAQTILVGETASLKIETTGKAPWTITVTNGTKDSVVTASANPYTFRIAPGTTSTYTISKVTNSCGTGKGAGSARVQVDPILGVEPVAPKDWIKVYPTIVQEKCRIEVQGTIAAGDSKIEIFDLNGNARSKQPLRENVTEVDFRNLPSGLYLLRVQNGGLNSVQRILKP